MSMAFGRIVRLNFADSVSHIYASGPRGVENWKLGNNIYARLSTKQWFSAARSEISLIIRQSCQILIKHPLAIARDKEGVVEGGIKLDGRRDKAGRMKEKLFRQGWEIFRLRFTAGR